MREDAVNQLKWRDLADPRFKANPYPLYARMRAEAPVSRIRAPLGQVAWLVARYEDVFSVLKDERFSNNWPARMPDLLHRLTRPVLRHMLTLDPPDHTRLRTLVSKAFTPRRVEGLRERIENVCSELLNAMAVNGEADLVSGYALLALHPMTPSREPVPGIAETERAVLPLLALVILTGIIRYPGLRRGGEAGAPDDFPRDEGRAHS